MRRFLFVLAGLAAVIVPVAALATGPTPAAMGSPDVGSITTGNGYTTVTITFTEPAFTSQTTDGDGAVTGASGDLVAGDFTFTDSSGGGVTIDSVTKGATAAVWTIGFSGTLAPNADTIAVDANEVFTASGDPFPAATLDVPISNQELDAALDALRDVRLPLHAAAGVASLPMIAEWFTATDTADVDGDGLTDDLRDRTVAEVVTGLASLTVVSQEQLETALEAVAGIDDVTFSGGDVVVSFDPTAPSATIATSGVAGAADVDGDDTNGTQGVELADDVSLDLGIQGGLTLSPSGASATVATGGADELSVVLDGTVPLSPQVKLGFVGVGAPSSEITFNNAGIAVDLTCSVGGPSCSPTDLAGTASLTGDAELSVPEVTVTDGTGTTSFTAAPDDVLTLSWSDLSDLSTLSATLNLPDLANFGNVDLDRAIASLEFLSAWFVELDRFSAMGQPLPVIGQSLGELGRNAAGFAQAVGDGANEVVKTLTGDTDLDGTPDVDPQDVDAQSLVEHLCDAQLFGPGETCSGLLTPVEVTTDAITYDLHLELTRTTGEDPEDVPGIETVALALGEDLAALQLAGELSTPIDVTTTATFDLTLGLDLRSDATLISAYGLNVDDFDDDGVLNASDPDVDGDLRDDDLDGDWQDEHGTVHSTAEGDDGADEDDDADGLPETYTLGAGDLCRAAAGLVGVDAETFAAAQSPTVDVTADGWEAACDDHVATGNQIEFAGSHDVDGDGVDDGSPYALTADDVCFLGANQFLVVDPDAADPRGDVVDTFVARNSGFSDAASCASALEAAVDSGTGTFGYDDADVPGSPVRLGHRAFVDAGELLTAGLTVNTGTIGVTARLGFLDLGLSGTLDAAPSATLSLVDVGAADGRITLTDLATAADGGTLGSLVDLTFGGPVSAHVELTNTAVLGPGIKHIDVVGDLSALDNTDPTPVFEFHSTALPDTSGLAADRIHVGTDLGDLVNFESITPAQIRVLIRRLAEQLIALAGDEALDTEIPFIGVRIHEMVDFADRWGDIAQQVLDRAPQTASALSDALGDALAAAGMPSGVDLVIDGDALEIGFDASHTVSRSYPFSFDLEGFPIAPADGGASINATGAIAWSPTLGIDLSALTPVGSETEFAALQDALYLRGTDLTLTGNLDGSVFGTVNLGPVNSGISGTLNVAATLGLDIDDDSDGIVLLDEIASGLVNGTLLETSFSGPFSANLSVSNPSGSLTVSGDLSDLSATTISHDLDLGSLTIDLDTLVQGILEVTRFTGRMLESSDELDIEVPLLGDLLQGADDLGSRMQALADQVETVYESAADGAAFVASIETAMESALCTGAVPGCDVTVSMVDGDGAPSSFADAESITFDLDFGFDHTGTEPVDEGVSVDGVFDAGLAFSAGVEYGYQAGLTFGVSRSEGFFLEGGELLSLYAGLSASDIDSDVSIFGVPIAEVVNGTASIGGLTSGGLGPRGTAAGFSVNIPDLSLRGISNRHSDIDGTLSAGVNLKASLDLPLQTTSSAGDVPLPAFHFPVFFDWEVDGTEIGQPSLSIGSATDQVRVEVGSLIGDCDQVGDEYVNCTGLIAPLWVELGELNPLADPKIKGVLTDEIPVLDASLLDIAEELGVPGVDIAKFLLSLDGTPPAVAGGGAAIEFGWVEVLPTFAFHENTTSWQCQNAGLATTLSEIFGGLMNFGTCPGGGGGGSGAVLAAPDASAGSGDADGGAGTLQPAAAVGFSAGGCTSGTQLFNVEVPLLDDPTQILSLLLGPELVDPVSFIQMCVGSGDVPLNIGPQINYSVTLFDLDIGFLKGSLKVGFAGGLGVQLRLGVGYDSTGLLPGRDFLDGFYIVDFYNSTGKDVQEVSAGGFVSGFIDGKFSVLGDIAAAHFKGSAGVNLTAGLDLFDESPSIREQERGDGRFHFHEMGTVMAAHMFPGLLEPDYDVLDAVGFELDDVLCIFRPEIDFSARLSFRAKAKALGITVFDETFSDEWTIINESITCALGKVAAQLDDSRLVLNAGPEFGLDRFDGSGDVAESFEIWRGNDADENDDNTPNLDSTGSFLWVKWTGANPGDFGKRRFRVSEVTRGIFGDLGAHDDTVTVLNDLGVPMTLLGGGGEDTLQGSNADDELDGGAGDDDLDAGAGDDRVSGGPGDDGLTGGPGDDVLGGNDGNDTYRFDDGWGADDVSDALGDDTLDFSDVAAGLTGTSFFGDAEVSAGPNVVRYFESDIDVLLGGSGADDVTLKSYVPDGFRIDLQGGDDHVLVPMSGQARTIEVDDTGATSGDELEILGTAAGDTFLFRGQAAGINAANAHDKRSDPATQGFVALISPTDLVDRVDHTVALEDLVVHGGIGGDVFAFDDNASGDRTTVHGGEGDDAFQVGQIFGDATTLLESDGTPVDPSSLCRATMDNIDDQPVGSFPRCIGYRDGAVGVASGDEFATQDTTRGFLSNGITHPATLNGGEGNDLFQVFANQAAIDLNGENGDDTFIVRAFALEGSVSASVLDTSTADAIGMDLGTGADHVEYAQNAPVTINGGDGFDTVILVGTEFGDGILIAEGSAKICPVLDLADGTLKTGECAFSSIAWSEVEALGVQALEGNDLVLALSTSTDYLIEVYGGEHDDTVFLGRDAGSPSTLRGGDLTGIEGPLAVFGESDPTFDATIPTAIALPHETVGEPEPVSPLSGGTEEGDVLVVDGSDATTDQVGALDLLVDGEHTFSHLTGLGTGAGVTLEVEPGVTAALPEGVVYEDLEYVDVRLGSGGDDLTVHRSQNVLVDHDDDEETDPLDVPGLVSTDTMHPATPVKVHFGGEVAPLRIQGADGDDTVNVRDVEVATRILGQNGGDTVNLGSAMPSKPGVLEELDAYVDVQGGAGTDTLNLDDTAESGDQTGNVDLELVTGLGLHELGVRYVEVETLDLDLGSADEVVNVRGTTATTTVHGNDGDERYYVSDVADLTTATFTDHLLGTLDDIGGDLTLDSGAGRHLLMVSDEDAGAGDGAGALTASSVTGLSVGDITYTTAGSWADGVTVWTSQHDDTIDWTGAHLAAGVRTITTLNTGDGGDAVTVSLLDGTDGFAVLNLEEGDDTADGQASTRDLIVFGSAGGDHVTTGSGHDLVLGDLGNVTYQGSTTLLGNGGPGDATDGQIVPIATIADRQGHIGGTDTIVTGDGDDVVFGGAVGDTIDTGDGADVALGDTGRFDADADEPRYTSTLYLVPIGGDDVLHLGAGEDLALGQHADDQIHGGPGDDLLTGGHDRADGLDGDDTVYGDGDDDTIAGDNAVVAPGVPVHLRDVGTTFFDGAAAWQFGDDALHGGDDDDTAFGQAGHDEVHGDAGRDQLEGNAGDDLMSGGDGQDDVVGGGSASDGLIVDTRVGNGLLDGADTIDGGADPDAITGDNARVLRPGGLDPANGAELRAIVLFDVEMSGGAPVPADVHGADTIAAGDGDDWAFGQGDGDTIEGGAGDDRIEGNHGSDTVFGGPNSDDITGGGSANDGVIDDDRDATGLLDEGDLLYGDDRAAAGADPTDGHDVVAGDNSWIDRLTEGDGTWTTIARTAGGVSVARVVRTTTMPDTRGDTAVYGSDVIRGNGGDDELFGQHDDGGATTLNGVGCIDGSTLDATAGHFAGDLVCGDAGEDAIVADEGFVTNVRAEDRDTTDESVTTKSPFIDETIHVSGTIVREVRLDEIGAGGGDVVFGGEDRDHIHAGAGDDLVNAGAGDDAVFGGNGDDGLWGDVGHDRAYGGFGEDAIDVKPRDTAPVDPDAWWVVAPLIDRDDNPLTTNGKDTHYGGWDADELQADEGDAGPVEGDRLVDWQGAYNAFYVCNGAYGAGRVEREISPDMVDVWQRLAHGDGAFDVMTLGSSGEVELALVYRKQIKDNTNPTHPNHPGHFTCEGP